MNWNGFPPSPSPFIIHWLSSGLCIIKGRLENINPVTSSQKRNSHCFPCFIFFFCLLFSCSLLNFFKRIIIYIYLVSLQISVSLGAFIGALLVSLQFMHVQSCLTFCNHINCSMPDSSAHRIFQTGILKWFPISYPVAFWIQALNPCLLCFLPWQVASLPWHHLGSPLSGFFFLECLWSSRICINVHLNKLVSLPVLALKFLHQTACYVSGWATWLCILVSFLLES